MERSNRGRAIAPCRRRGGPITARVRRRRFVRSAAGLCLCCAIGCADTDVRPPPQVVVAEFDPSAMPPQIPLPNDLTMMPAPPTSPAFATFSGPIDPATISAMSVIVIDTNAMAPILGATATFDSATNRLVVMPPPSGWPVGHRVAIALRGSPGGLLAPGGIPVVASPAFFFARSATPVATCATPMPGCMSTTPALPLEQAIPLEQLREALAPLVNALEQLLGVPRGELALAWTFTVGMGAPVDAGVDGGVSDGGMAMDAAPGGG